MRDTLPQTPREEMVRTEPNAEAALRATAHTPGPWTIETRTRRNTRGQSPELLISSAAGGVITRRGLARPSTGEGRANARLIAAAPDLLEALRHILAGALSLPRFAEDEARAAIAKATGQ